MARTFEIEKEGAYLCPKCAGWYTRVPNDDPEDICNTKHSQRACCHYNEKSSSQFEVTAAQGHMLAKSALNLVKAGQHEVGLAKYAEAVGASSKLADAVLPRQMWDKNTGQMHTYYNAEIFVVPGRDDGLWYDLAGLREAVRQGRRPPSDVVVAERSLRVTTETSREVAALLEQVKVFLDAHREAPAPVIIPAAAATPPAAAAAKFVPQSRCGICGATYRRGQSNRHQRTAAHKAFVASKAKEKQSPLRRVFGQAST